MKFNGEIAFVTGGSRGIGKAICQRLAEYGAKVAIGYRSSKDNAESVKDDIVARDGHAFTVEIDVTKSASIDKAFTAVEDNWGSVELLINNAGITSDGLFLRMNEDSWSDVIDTNLSGASRTSRRAIRGMMKNRFGVIINISSLAGLTGNAGQCNYAAAKAGLVALTRSLAAEVGSRGIRVNAVAPGMIDTDMAQQLSDRQLKTVVERTAVDRLGEPEEVADAVCFLASGTASYITGEVLVVDGGLSVGL